MGHPHHGQQGQLLPLSPFHRRLTGRLLVPLALLAVCAPPSALAQSARDRRRAEREAQPERPPGVSESQATELTLTLNEVAVRPIQIWIRTAGVIGPDGRTLTASVTEADGEHIRPGQRVRAFPPESRSSMYQARVLTVARAGGRVDLRVVLAGDGRDGSRHYVLEIVTEPVEVLSVPNEAIIETGARRLVYVQQSPGQFAPREIEAGIQGELYTEIRGGLSPGDQVVSFGSFFIDAEHQLKGPS